MQGPNTNNPAEFQGHPPIKPSLPLTYVKLKVIEPKMWTLLFTYDHIRM